MRETQQTPENKDEREVQPAPANGSAGTRVTVVISAGQSRNPEKRALESAVSRKSTAGIEGVEVVTIPHLYDCAAKGESFQRLSSTRNDLVVISWLYERAAHWVLDRNAIQGQVGEVELIQEADDDEDQEPEDSDETRVTDLHPRPDRRIYCIDFRVSERAEDYAEEVARIVELTQPRTPLTLEMLARYENPTNDTFVGSTATPSDSTLPNAVPSAADTGPDQPTPGSEANHKVTSIDEHPARRWYPVIDFSRCTNCMECIDFCLFGVYGIDSSETIVVEQADNCRKGCPACSRVCPQNAIIFPQHKTPAIAGAPVDAGALKIDLSKLFGAPESDEDAAAVAARERDEQLILAGRQAVGQEGGEHSDLKSRLSQNPKPGKTDDLDNLIDELDSLDL